VNCKLTTAVDRGGVLKRIWSLRLAMSDLILNESY
jgi:hypothetical protein